MQGKDHARSSALPLKRIRELKRKKDLLAYIKKLELIIVKQNLLSVEQNITIKEMTISLNEKNDFMDRLNVVREDMKRLLQTKASTTSPP